MEPASSIIAKLGGPSAVSRIVGVHRTRVSNWMRSKEVGGTGGNIPFKHVPALLKAAEEKGEKLATDDFLPVAEREEAA